MMGWFNSREPRERVLLMILAVLLIISVGWFAMTREAGPDPDVQLSDAQIDRELWLRAAPRLSVGSGGDVTRAPFTRGAIINLARSRDIALTRVQPQNDGSLTVWIDDVGTGPLFGLMQSVTRDYAVDLQSVMINRTPRGGLNAQFTLMPLT